MPKTKKTYNIPLLLVFALIREYLDIMKKDIHPKYYKNAKISCACGNSFAIGATREKLAVEICSKCHPFYTGKHQLIDTARRAEKFSARRAKASLEKVQTKKTKETERTVKKQTKDKSNKK